MDEKEKEKYILGFMHSILTDERNQNKYCMTMFGNFDENKMITLSDCISYLENKYQKLCKKE